MLLKCQLLHSHREWCEWQLWAIDPDSSNQCSGGMLEWKSEIGVDAIIEIKKIKNITPISIWGFGSRAQSRDE